MYQYDDPTAVSALPTPATPGTAGFFTNGNPATSTPATVLGADFMNTVMLELLGVVSAGGVTPSKTNNTQVALAIENLIESRSGNYALDTGVANAYVVALSPPITVYTNGLSVRWKVLNTNTVASTLNAGAGAVPIVRDDGAAVQGGDLPAGSVVTSTFDTTAHAFFLTSVVASQFGALAGMSTVSVAGAGDVTLTQAQYGFGIIKLTGFITANINVIFPVNGKWSIVNATTGAFTVTCKTAAGTGTIVVQGKTSIVQGDGTNIQIGFSDIATALGFTPVNKAGDTMTGNLGINMTPVNVLDITKNQNAGTAVSVFNNNGGTAAAAALLLNSGTASGSVFVASAGFTPTGIFKPNQTTVYGNGGALALATIGAQPVIVGVNSAEVARWSTAGRLLLNTTADDGIHQLQVNGTATATAPAAGDNSATLVTSAWVNANATGVVGTARNAKMSIAAASATATFTATEIIVQAGTGETYRLVGFNQSVNLATVGAGGMDTGTAPVSGYVALYAIYNQATATAALLAVNATSAVATEIYSGANMPAGYTTSALVSVWPTNASKQFVVGFQIDRNIVISTSTVLSTSTVVSVPTSLSIASVVPPNARSISGQLSVTVTGTANITLVVYSTSGGIGGIGIFYATAATGGVSNPTSHLPLSVSQTLFYSMVGSTGTAVFQIGVSGYDI